MWCAYGRVHACGVHMGEHMVVHACGVHMGVCTFVVCLWVSMYVVHI